MALSTKCLCGYGDVTETHIRIKEIKEIKELSYCTME